MSLDILIPSAAEPVTLETLKAHLRLEGTTEDELLTRLITAARAGLEYQAGLAFLAQTIAWRFDQWPEGRVVLPRSPVTAISEVALRQSDASWLAVPVEDHDLLPGFPSTLIPLGSWPEPATEQAGISVTFEAGYAEPAAVPAPLKQAVLLLAAHYYERRELVENARISPLPQSVATLIAPYRRVALCSAS